MNRLRQILKDRRGVAFPLIIAIVLVLVMLMCCISEYFRLLIVAQGGSGCGAGGCDLHRQRQL